MIVANHVTVQLHLSETYVQSQLRYAAKIASRESRLRQQRRRLEATRPPGDAGDDADMTAADDDESDSHDDSPPGTPPVPTFEYHLPFGIRVTSGRLPALEGMAIMQPSGDQPGQISSTELNMQLAALVEQRKKEKLVRRISPAAIHMQLRQVVAGWLTRSVHAGFRPPNAKICNRNWTWQTRW